CGRGAGSARSGAQAESRPVGDGRFGCFTVARTQQDIRDCLCGERRASTSDPWTNVLGNSYRTSLGCSSS
ncbi:MAG: hypothetical protein OXD44_10745, partial [Gammaproteobacteria bacterium]|nr:hypothetical protein [Gammaproteobacteria bacterium]